MQKQSAFRHQSDQEECVEGSLARRISELSDLHLRYTYSNTSSTSEFGLYEPTNSNQQLESRFVRDDQLFNEILQKLSEVKSIVFIENDDICLYLYQHYQWSTEKLINCFFSQNWTNLREKVKAYDPENSIIIEGTCPVCLEKAQLSSSGMCQHAYCTNCWSKYIRNQLQAGRIFFGCMDEEECPHSPVLKVFAKKVAPELRELYRKRICMNYALMNKDISYCPNDKCPYFCSKPSLMDITTVSCPCGELYCFRCEQPPHSPASCLNVQHWKELINSQDTNQSWIKNNARECPKCKQPIEKKVGCSLIKCICQCEFCYECGGIWDTTHSESKGECPKRLILGVREKLVNRVVQIDEELTLVMKEAERNEASLRLCETLVEEEAVRNKVIQVKVEVVCAWMALRWAKIVLGMEGKPPIEKQFEIDFLQSIRNTMEPVEHIIKCHNNMATRDLYQYGELVLQRKQILKKNKTVWIEAFDTNLWS